MIENDKQPSNAVSRADNLTADQSPDPGDRASRAGSARRPNPFNAENALAHWLRYDPLSNSTIPQTARDCSELVRCINRHGLPGIVLEIFEQARSMNAKLPDTIAWALRQTAMSVTAANSSMMLELESILTPFNQTRIPVMLLKGSALNLTLYDRPNLRPMSDLDLLIHPQDAARAIEILEIHGCRRGHELVRDDFFPTYYYEQELFTALPGSARVDLHAMPFRPMRLARLLPVEEFWHGAREVFVGGAHAYIPSAEVMFIHLSAHAAFHGCARWIWLCDIKRFAKQHQDLDWNIILHRTQTWHLSSAVSLAIKQTEELLGPFCPQDVRLELANHSALWRDRLMLAHAPCDAASPIMHILINLLCTPGLRYRLGYLRAMLTPTDRHLAGIYPYRHIGWPLCAHLWRLLRAPFRLPLIKCLFNRIALTRPRVEL